MNKLNLSTKPFYNERIINLILGASIVFLFLFFLKGVSQLGVLLDQESALQRQLLEERGVSEALAAEAIELLRESGPTDSGGVSEEMEIARRLVERRIFSWSAFLSNLENAIPPSVMLTAVTPQISDNAISFSLGIRGRTANDLNIFLEALEEESEFSELLIKEEELIQGGDYTGVLEGVYRGVKYQQ
tara:strand:- start:23478 stop:24041 length:564 start_codon:yes stop_codon:yes gene_type:complete